MSWLARFAAVNSIMDTVDFYFMTAKKHENKNLAVNAKWTSSKDVQGWRQFRICGRRYDEFGALWLELMAVCDRNARLWIPASDLIPEKESPGLWNPGWK